MELKSANTEYSVQLEQLTQQLDVLTSRKQQLEDEMAVSAVKREAAQLYEQVLYGTVLYCTVLSVLYCAVRAARRGRVQAGQAGGGGTAEGHTSSGQYPILSTRCRKEVLLGVYLEEQSADYGSIQTSLALLDSYNSARRL